MARDHEPSGELLLYLADSLLAAGIQYGLWVERAPGVEEEVAMSSMSQDKLGHARAFQQLAEKVLGRTAVELQYERSADEYTWNWAWTLPLPTWDHMILAKALFARATFAEIEALSPESGAAALLPKLRQEERWHLRHADAWLGERAQAERSAMQEALDELWPAVVAFHGGNGERFPADRASGALIASDDALQAAFIKDATGRSVEVGLKAGPTRVDGAAVVELKEQARENALEIVALLQDPAGRAIAEL